MAEDKEKILETIAKLLTLAEDQAHAPEGQAARRMAMKWMAKHNIEESEIILKNAKAGVQTIFEDEDGWEGAWDQGGRRAWVTALASSICSTFNGRYWISGRNHTLHFLGTASDLETILYFMDVVFGHIERAARKECPKPDQWKKRNVFGQAAWAEVDRRLRQIKQEMEGATKEYSGGYDLVILKNQVVEQTVDDLFKERGYGQARQSAWHSSTDSRLIAKGADAGRSAPLNRAIQN